MRWLRHPGVLAATAALVAGSQTAGLAADARPATLALSPWRVVFKARTPDLAITSITAPGPRDAWAVGSYRQPHHTAHAVVMHWNGRRWSAVKVTAFPPDYSPESVLSTGPDNVWITGVSAPPDDAHYVDLRFNGTGWRIVPVVDDPGVNELAATTLVTGRDSMWGIQVIGCSSVYPGCVTELQHWNGTAYSSYTIPAVVTSMTRAGHSIWLTGIAHAATPVSAAAVGEPVVYRWTGRKWERFAGPWKPATAQDPSITGSPDGGLWLTYYLNVRGSAKWLVRHWSQGQWSAIPVPRIHRRPALLISTPIVYDRKKGFWSLYAHWTGTKWIDTYDFSNRGLSHDLYTSALLETVAPAPIPHASSAWAVACIGTNGGLGPDCKTAIVANGRLP